jgi:uncharacterized protein YgiM (DUF1202 family)
MNKRKTLFFAGLVLIFSMACSLSNNATSGSAVFPVSVEAPAAPPVPAAPSLSPTPSPECCTVTTGATQGLLNLRACPGTSCEVLAVLNDGDHLTVLELGDWLKVQPEKGQEGYINSNYCKFSEVQK